MGRDRGSDACKFLDILGRDAKVEKKEDIVLGMWAVKIDGLVFIFE